LTARPATTWTGLFMAVLLGDVLDAVDPLD
jgi:hypothetical protein